jgi:prepilin-type processing-associated H-X9-DG protein
LKSFRVALPLATVLSITIASVAEAQTVAVAPADLSAPERTVQTLVAAINRGDLDAVAACVAGGKVSDELRAALRGTRPTLSITNIRVKTRGDERAFIKATVSFASPGGSELNSRVETAALRREGRVWKIMPPPLTDLTDGRRTITLLGKIVWAASDVASIKPTEQEAHTAASVANVRQICLAAMMLLQDSDEVYKVPPGDYKNALMPYVRNAAVFTSPLDKAGTVSYKFNSKLADVPLMRVARPAYTVMIYEGQEGRPAFRNGGKAVIGFADGHVRLISPQEAARLRWNP